MDESSTSVIIVGGGFGGLNAAKGLANEPQISVTLIDKSNYHLFQPLLYQVATAGLSPADIASPIRSILARAKNIQVVLGQVQTVDLERKIVRTDFADLKYDYLVLACGAETTYFGHDAWPQFAPSLKSLEEATEIRKKVLVAYEKAERELDPEKQKTLLTFIVVGGGPTGVELAGALAEIGKFTLSRDFRHIDPKSTRVMLIEAGERILPSFSTELSQQATMDLLRMGVQVVTNCRVKEISDEGIVTANGDIIKASTVLWAAGVKPSSLNTKLNLPLDNRGRILVSSDLSVAGYPEIFCIGDQAHVKDKNGSPLPGLAPVAIQQGVWVAKNILRDRDKKPRKPFEYRDKGQMATIGRKKAVVEFGKMKMSGYFAWLMWLLVHIYYLIGFQNKVLVLIQWAWSYVTFKRGARLIVEPRK